MSRPSKKTQAFDNRAKLQELQNKEPTECCDDSVVFLLKDRHHEFSLDLKTLLRCLEFAEEQGALPELPAKWWWKANSL